jgi:hypothetical protein
LDSAPAGIYGRRKKWNKVVWVIGGPIYNYNGLFYFFCRIYNGSLYIDLKSSNIFVLFALFRKIRMSHSKLDVLVVQTGGK